MGLAFNDSERLDVIATVATRAIRNRDTRCWEWTCHRESYGNIRGIPAHRASWAAYVGPIPDGLRILHQCDNKRCVNPDHLFIGTQQDNMQDWYHKRQPGLEAVVSPAGFAFVILRTPTSPREVAVEVLNGWRRSRNGRDRLFRSKPCLSIEMPASQPLPPLRGFGCKWWFKRKAAKCQK